ncbi:hypothetical protein T4B_7433 [Trichinella pseudospiralis]|uniref:Uncharacterized protein n=1 Tax=Trichinella pseudospiralis TaxID=6337 RepID=A0A0V1I672_TRIPS|nr:hypothetical protein T4E_11668 [Trichinella pseudospiralis]KRY65538.1 hypothetical protein T4A_5303 [Trichinella pseudospiralis]KRZ17924.1 hypothetical protein T4B_7433 [Trichinella pseudospiralis]KRZ26462.1 hypothetical protein T4C_5433 [Trichinella pseudospiralis]
MNCVNLKPQYEQDGIRKFIPARKDSFRQRNDKNTNSRTSICLVLADNILPSQLNSSIRYITEIQSEQAENSLFEPWEREWEAIVI